MPPTKIAIQKRRMPTRKVRWLGLGTAETFSEMALARAGTEECIGFFDYTARSGVETQGPTNRPRLASPARPSLGMTVKKGEK